MRQDLVVDLDELQRLPGGVGIDGGDGGNGMAVIERLVARHAVVEDVVHAAIAIGEIGQVGAVMTALTPGSFSAFEVSIFLILAWACGERRTRPTSWPGALKSAP